MNDATRPIRPLRRVSRWLGGAVPYLLAAGVPSLAAGAQPTSTDPLEPPRNGILSHDPTWHALVGATVHPEPGSTIENALVEFRDGRITRVAADADPSRGARVWDADGLHVYPGLIDAYVEVEVPEPDADAPGVHWNPSVTPQRTALDADGPDAKLRERLRELGFTAAGIAPKSGVLRGRGAVVSLAADPDADSAADPPAYRDDFGHLLSFETSGWPSPEYPGSHMGAVALIRQTLIDADHRARLMEAGEAEGPSVLDALADRGHTLFFEVDHELKALHAAKVAREAGRPAALIGHGTSYKRLDPIVEDGLPIVAPLRFPQTPIVDSVGAADSVSLEQLMAWEQAPTNPRRLDDAGLDVSLTSSKVKKRNQFHENLRRAIDEGGLPEHRALAMLTTNPANLLGVDHDLGTLEPGKLANILVTDGPLFEKDTTIRDLWIDGRRHEINPAPPEGVSGTWTLHRTDDDRDWPATLVIDADKKKVSFTIEGEEELQGRNLSIEDDRVSFLLDEEAEGEDAATIIVSALIEGDTISGLGRLSDDQTIPFRGERVEPDDADETQEAQPDAEDAEPDEQETTDVPENYGYPFGPYAMEEPPEQRQIYIHSATIWTSGPRGIIDNGAMAVADGEIIGVWDLDEQQPPFALSRDVHIIDASGKHITPGIVDCHSHTGLFRFGVNEGTQAVTSEVRIADAVDPGHINWYRQLAGGVTTVNSLHGSANPIGGHNLVQKIRWGAAHPDDMHLQGAPPGIKFALGENVKQSNWGDRFTTRYPQTRMGVETIIRDRFNAARHYAQRRAKDPDATRRDLELEALAEILEGDRLIHCHSYRQDEILMLARLAGEYGFTIGTFQHVLEGYKVAEVIEQHALGASAFSDWWAYKVEVQDAIPHNGAIMHDVGVVVSFNSDSDELARRMNTEAAKAVKYGGVSPEDALEFVTINPAIQLGIEDRVGSLEKGKDADFVIWSGDPLSTRSRCEATYIDGREYFSTDADAAHRSRIIAERKRIIQKILAEGRRDKDTKDADEPDNGDEDAEEAESPDEAEDPGSLRRRLAQQRLERLYLQSYNRDVDPARQTCGACGCTFVHDLRR